MIKKIVLKSKNDYYTYLNQIFYGLGNIEKKYNWLIADYECNYYPNEKLEKNRHNYMWLSGEELRDLIVNNEIQFIWGVFLAFDKDIKLDDILKFKLPHSRLNIVNNKIDMQNAMCTIEIISYDSTEVYILSRESEYIKEFVSKFPEAKELELHDLM